MYPLKETNSEENHVRTRKNIIDSDGTLIIVDKSWDKGTLLTKDICIKENKPFLISTFSQSLSQDDFLKWITNHNIHRLNIAGPRESNSPGIYFKTIELLKQLFFEVRKQFSDNITR